MKIHCCFCTKIYIFFFILIFIYETNASSMNIYNEYELCKYTLSDGNKVDFLNLRRTSDYLFSIGRYEYKANFCGPLVMPCVGSLTPAAIFLKGNVYTCISRMSTGWGQTTMDYIDRSVPNKGVKIIIPGGDRCYVATSQYTVEYVMKCDMNKEIEFETIVKKQYCGFEYHFASKYACPAYFIQESSINSKKILFFLIIIFTLYCIGFSYKNYRENPEDGILKAFPHREFWGNFIDDARHGVNVVVRNIQEKIGGNKVNSYDSF